MNWKVNSKVSLFTMKRKALWVIIWNRSSFRKVRNWLKYKKNIYSVYIINGKTVLE